MKNTREWAAVGLMSLCCVLAGCGGSGGAGTEASDDSGEYVPLAQPNAALHDVPQGTAPESSTTAQRTAYGPEARNEPGAANKAPGSPSHAPAAMNAIPGNVAAAPSPQAILLNKRAVRGLDNLKGSCFINAALQVIAHDETLRKRVLNAQAVPEVHTFFAHYDQPNVDLTKSHAEIVAYIRKTGHMPAGAGYTEVVLDMLGTRYRALWLQEQNAILTHLSAGERYFNVSAISDQTNRHFARLPENASVKHFVYYTGGHYLTYLNDGERWIEANDAKVREVDVAMISALANKQISQAAYNGIAFIGYR